MVAWAVGRLSVLLARRSGIWASGSFSVQGGQVAGAGGHRGFSVCVRGGGGHMCVCPSQRVNALWSAASCNAEASVCCFWFFAGWMAWQVCRAAAGCLTGPRVKPGSTAESGCNTKSSHKGLCGPSRSMWP
eukprot:365119-Chlamydomonas_euryale.AAC.16